MRVVADPAELAGWSADARSTARRLGVAIEEVESGWGPLAAVWDGAAATGFDEHRARWRSASTGLRTTLDALADLLDTAGANFAGVAAANARIWGGGEPAVGGPAVVRSVSAGMPTARIDVEIDDVRATVRALVGVTVGCGDAWSALATSLNRSAAMAGDDAAGAAFSRDVDATVAAAWQGWRAAARLLRRHLPPDVCIRYWADGYLPAAEHF